MLNTNIEEMDEDLHPTEKTPLIPDDGDNESVGTSNPFGSNIGGDDKGNENIGMTDD
mgnify:CR=1 FL=1